MTRYCKKCGHKMIPVKNGFSAFVITERVYVSGDLWGCHSCQRFQLHGFHKYPAKGKLSLIYGKIEKDPGNESMFAITDPSIYYFPEDFQEHMDEYYSWWNWKGYPEEGGEADESKGSKKVAEQKLLEDNEGENPWRPEEI